MVVLISPSVIVSRHANGVVTHQMASFADFEKHVEADEKLVEKDFRQDFVLNLVRQLLQELSLVPLIDGL